MEAVAAAADDVAAAVVAVAAAAVAVNSCQPFGQNLASGHHSLKCDTSLKLPEREAGLQENVYKKSEEMNHLHFTIVNLKSY